MGTQRRGPTLVTTEPTGAVSEARVPVPVVAMFRWAPPFGDESPHPVPAVAVAWTTAQVRVRGSAPGVDAEVWLPARDVHRIHPVDHPESVVARVPWRRADRADVPGRVQARATTRAGAVVAVRVLLAPGTDEAAERWLLVTDLVDEDPLDGVAD
jgi:hypothetical protein